MQNYVRKIKEYSYAILLLSISLITLLWYISYVQVAKDPLPARSWLLLITLLTIKNGKKH